MLSRRMSALFKGIKWLLIICLIGLASLSIALRLVLPNMGTAQIPLQRLMQKASGFDLSYSSLKGDLRFFTPALEMQDLVLKTEKEGKVLAAKKVDIRIDLLASLLSADISFSHIAIDGLTLDLTKIPKQKNAESITLAERLERLFLVNLNDFSLTNSIVKVPFSDNAPQIIEIDSLMGSNKLNEHKMHAIASVKGSSLNQVEINAQFKDQGGLSTLNGHFYFHGQDISLTKWVAPFVKEGHKLPNTNISGSALFKLKEGSLNAVRIQLEPSSFAALNSDFSLIGSGDVFLLKDEQDSWTLETQDLVVQSKEQRWRELALKMRLSKQAWRLNIDELDLALLMAVGQLNILPTDIDEALAALAPRGKVQDLRLQKYQHEPFAYSAKVNNLSFEAWKQLPKTQNISFDLAGTNEQGKASVDLNSTSLPYNPFFQAPLRIKEGKVDLFWQRKNDDFYLWSNHVAINTTHLDLKTHFLLSLHDNQPPWLSLYAEASLNDAGETWRYLPIQALAPELTDYLSQSIRAGQVNNAKILLNGKLDALQLKQHQSVFQAFVPLREAEFSFNTQWPVLNNLDIDLLFDANELFLDAKNMTSRGARGYDLSGKIIFEENQPLQIQTKIDASGRQLRQYMLATPLVDTVGAALTHVQIDGNIKGELFLTLPFNGDQPNVEGAILLQNNQLSIASPEMTFKQAAGEIVFKNDSVWSKSIKSTLLSQDVEVDFQGATVVNKYAVNINMKGNWDSEILKTHLQTPSAIPLEGMVDWTLNTDLALQDIGFNYNVKLDASLAKIQSLLPSPFDTQTLSKGDLKLNASGDKYELFMQIEAPNLQYQGRVDLTKPIPFVKRGTGVIGKGELYLNPLFDNVVSINLPKLNASEWILVYDTYTKNFDEPSSLFAFPPISRLNLDVKHMEFSNLVFHDLSLALRRKDDNLHFVANSQELVGNALWLIKEQKVKANINQFFINPLPSSDKDNRVSRPDRRLATEEDQALMMHFPSVELSINDLWIKGHRFGKLDLSLEKSLNRLTLSDLKVRDADNEISINGNWFIDEAKTNNTVVNFLFRGQNSSVLMERFAFKDGIEGASFKTEGKIDYKSVPWAIDTKTLYGNSKTELKKGFISGVGGASKFLGLFSLDSIIRKLKLDFSDVFDDGLTFDQIKGSIDIAKGVATTKDIEMKALAGDMYINGVADLNKNTVNANVRFVPDLASGIPVLTAFAVAPQTAIYVLAVTTVLSPVIEAFTQIQYQVTGNIDKPVVKEVSRRRGEIEISEQVTERLRSQ